MLILVALAVFTPEDYKNPELSCRQRVAKNSERFEHLYSEAAPYKAISCTCEKHQPHRKGAADRERKNPYVDCL
jgi:hypothetical protein